jgi:hypothetical protein
MVEPVATQELNMPGQKQDCGCGCGGDLCGTGWQELVFVGSKETRDRNELTAKGCGCGCDGSCGCGGG